MEFLDYMISFWVTPLKIIFWIVCTVVPLVFAGFVAEECENHRSKKTVPNGIVRNAPLIFGYIIIHYVVLILIGLPWLFYSIKVS